MSERLTAAASPLRAALGRQTSEDHMAAELVGAARIGGWLAYHTHDARRSPAGFPDWVFLRGGELLAWELKRTGKKPTPAQEAWLGALQGFIEAHGLGDWCEARVVRPENMDDCLRRLMRRDGLPDVEVA